MKNVCMYMIHAGILFGVIAGNWYGLEAVGNLALAAVWIIILITLLALAAVKEKKDEKKDQKNTFGKYLHRILFGTSVTVMLMAGWFVTAFCYFMVWVATWIKRQPNSTPPEESA